MRNKLISKEDVIRDTSKEPSKLRRWWRNLTYCDWFPYSIKKVYYGIVPYNYRPGQLWYKTKCFCWHRYSTVRPKGMGHTWCDRDHLLVETMFQILSDFVEKECVESIVDWYHEDAHTVKVNGVEVRAIDEMLALYNWWHLKYKKAYKEIEEGWWDKAFALEANDEGDWSFETKFKNPKEKELHHFYVRRTMDMEILVEEELQVMLKRLINVRRSMWT
jgi:hypothetical protein